MSTELENFVAMLTRIGYVTNVTPSANGEELCVTISPDEGVVEGYWNFYADFTFSKDGALKNIGIWG